MSREVAMTEQNPNPVVVAVGTDGMDAAMGYAAAEATRLGCGLHLVHVVHVLPQGPEMVSADVTDYERVGRQTLNAALRLARELIGDDTLVTGDLLFGGVVPKIVEAAANARMVVLQHRDLSRLRRVVTRSVASGVAAHARVPVVSVPESWSAGHERETSPTVTVGVDVAENAGEVLRIAIEAARARGATLHVLHTWSFPSAYDDIIMNRVDDDEWAPRATAEVQAALDGLGDQGRGLPVRIEAKHMKPAEALIRASQDADLVVIGRHDPLTPLGSHLGPVARAVLAGAECPVLLADPRPGRRRNGHLRSAAPRAGQDTH
jgi:nucleotide-binding universal stress UspA family protein